MRPFFNPDGAPAPAPAATATPATPAPAPAAAETAKPDAPKPDAPKPDAAKPELMDAATFEAKQRDAIAATQKSWEEASLADPEIGGQKLAATVEAATQVVDAFASPALKELFKETQLDKHPEVRRFMAAIHKVISPDRLVAGRKAGVSGPRDMSNAAIASRLYPDS